jgi:hypothetical protein
VLINGHAIHSNDQILRFDAGSISWAAIDDRGNQSSACTRCERRTFVWQGLRLVSLDPLTGPFPKQIQILFSSSLASFATCPVANRPSGERSGAGAEQNCYQANRSNQHVQLPVPFHDSSPFLATPT